MHMRTANYLPSGLAEKGHDSELPASYHRGKAMIDIGQAEKKLKGSEQNVTESTPQVVDSFYLIDSHNLLQCCMGQRCPSVPWYIVHLNKNDDMMCYNI